MISNSAAKTMSTEISLQRILGIYVKALLALSWAYINQYFKNKHKFCNFSNCVQP